MIAPLLDLLDLFPDDHPHVADDAIVSVRGGRTFQPCAICGGALSWVPTGSGDPLPVTYATGECVGAGCPGRRRRD